MMFLAASPAEGIWPGDELWLSVYPENQESQCLTKPLNAEGPCDGITRCA
jgi:hypothetical protein